MTRYTYTFNKESSNVIKLIISEGGSRCAWGNLIINRPHVRTPNLESIAVSTAKQRRGLSYAIVYLLMLKAKDLNYAQVEVSDAHGYLINSLQKIGFKVTQNRPVPKPAAASLECDDIILGLTMCKRMMGQKGLIADGFRAVEVKWSRG